MELTPSQLSSLNEMGIPVWALRFEGGAEETIKSSDNIQSCDCLVLLESDSDEQTVKRLLHAILFSIGVNLEQCVIINAEKFPQLRSTTAQHKLLLVFGETFAQSLWGKSIVRGKLQEVFDPQIPTLVTFSLDELLLSPEYKDLAWQDLKLAKQIFDAI